MKIEKRLLIDGIKELYLTKKISDQVKQNLDIYLNKLFLYESNLINRKVIKNFLLPLSSKEMDSIRLKDFKSLKYYCYINNDDFKNFIIEIVNLNNDINHYIYNIVGFLKIHIDVNLFNYEVKLKLMNKENSIINVKIVREVIID